MKWTLPIDQGMTETAGISGEDADLAVLNPPNRMREVAIIVPNGSKRMLMRS